MSPVKLPPVKRWPPLDRSVMRVGSGEVTEQKIMNSDPIVEEVRAARRKIEEAAAKSGLSLGEYLRRNQDTFGAPEVSRKPQYLKLKRLPDHTSRCFGKPPPHTSL